MLEQSIAGHTRCLLDWYPQTMKASWDTLQSEYETSLLLVSSPQPKRHTHRHNALSIPTLRYKLQLINNNKTKQTTPTTTQNSQSEKSTIQDQLHREQHLARIDLVTHKIAKVDSSYDSQEASNIRSQRRQELQTINNQIKRNNRDTLHIHRLVSIQNEIEEQTMIQEKIETTKQETLVNSFNPNHPPSSVNFLPPPSNPPPPFTTSSTPFRNIQSANKAAKKWRKHASRDRIQITAMKNLLQLIHQLEFPTVESVPTIESIHRLTVASAELKWSNAVYSAHTIVQEEAYQDEPSTSYNRNVEIPTADASNEQIDRWQTRSNAIQCIRKSILGLAHVLVSNNTSTSTSVSDTICDTIMYQILNSIEERELLVAEVCRLSRKQYSSHQTPPPALQQILNSIARSSTSQQYTRALFDDSIRQMYINIDRSKDKQPTSKGIRSEGKAVEQSQLRILRAILSNTLELPPLIQATCCILQDANYDASNFLFGTLICNSIRVTLFLPYIQVVPCVAKTHYNDTITGAQTIKDHLSQVAFVLERVFGVSNLPDIYTCPLVNQNRHELMALSEIYAHKFGPKIYDFTTQLLSSVAGAFREQFDPFELSSVSRGVHIREQDLLLLCQAVVKSNSASFPNKGLFLEIIEDSLKSNNPKKLLVVPIVSHGKVDLIHSMNWKEIVELQDFELPELDMSWGDAARKLTHLKYTLAQAFHLIQRSQISYLSDEELLKVKSIGQELNGLNIFSQRINEIRHQMQKEMIEQNKRYVLLQQQSSGMLLRHLSSNNLDDGLLPLYRPLLNTTDSILAPEELEEDIYLNSAGASHHARHGDPLNVRSQKYIRGIAINDRIKIQDRPHGWCSPVKRTRMKSYAEQKEIKLMSECTFKPNLNVQRAVIKDLMKFKEKAESVAVDHGARPQWNHICMHTPVSRVVEERDNRFHRAERRASSHDEIGLELFRIPHAPIGTIHAHMEHCLAFTRRRDSTTTS